jgi:hypothetical protein
VLLLSRYCDYYYCGGGTTDARGHARWLRGPELVSRMIPASDKGSRYRRACFDSMPQLDK